MNINWSYIAGFMDGEGSITRHRNSNFRISIPQTNEEVLLEIMKFSRCGSVWKAAKRKAHWKENWVYCVYKQKDILEFLQKIHPFLIVKKSLAGKVIPEIRLNVFKNKKRKIDLQKRIKMCKVLREKGLSYRSIGKRLKIDHGYVRRLVLSE